MNPDRRHYGEGRLVSGALILAGIAVLIGPPAYAAYRLFEAITTNAPLYATRTVTTTTTQPYGALVHILPVLTLWIGALFFVLISASFSMPRGL